MSSKIKELTELEDFKRVYTVFSGPPYNEKYTDEELEEIFREYQEKGSMSRGIALKLGFTQIPDIYQDVERERMNGTVETMRNIFLEINLEQLTREFLKKGLEMVDPSKQAERGE